ncbi:hypothetical protein BM477_03175 [Boudabousia marimammalium]|uniref:YgjP-like metallopeptidase domain-containing protein n=1 Tax=Boudabousia marimammalium TaxID=156892 RepID=A0A1Q5PR27_9ACTO|nr:hypothetical protein BM477_03175 [Boudabousia marimammalium]
MASVPLRSTRAQIESFLVTNESWIRKTHDKVAKMRLKQALNWRQTGLLPVWGAQFLLAVEEVGNLPRQQAKLELDEGGLSMLLPSSLLSANGPELSRWPAEDAHALDRLVDSFYHGQVRSAGGLLIPRLSQEIAVKPGNLAVRKMKSRWGSCNPRTGRICLNSELARYDEKFLRYIVIHELAHLRHANHGAEFWTLVEKHEPQARELRKQLRQVSR